jgi:LPS sulfotransferase NodH
MHIAQILELKKSNINPLDLGFDLIVYVSRRNKIKQAISLARASLTDQWLTGVAGREASAEIPSSLIAQSLHHILESEQIYSTHLKQLVNKEFEYEDFQNLDTTAAYGTVLDLLGKSWSGSAKTTLERQADESSSTAVTKFMNHITGSPVNG